MHVGPLELDLIRRRAARGSRKLDLLAREFQLLEFLMRREGQVVTRRMLLENVFGYRFELKSNLVDVHMGRLRRKLDHPGETPLLETVRGLVFCPSCFGVAARPCKAAWPRSGEAVASGGCRLCNDPRLQLVGHVRPDVLAKHRSTVLLFETLDRSVKEQLELLAAHPADLLSFMIQSRMNGGPGVVTRVGLFETGGAPIVGDVTRIPSTLKLDGRVQAVIAPENPAEHWRAAGRRLPNSRVLVVSRGADEVLEVRADLARGAVAGIIPAILLSLAGGALVGFATERRLQRLNVVAERIIAGDLQERLPEKFDGDELDRLCAIVNRILGRLEEMVGALRAAGDNIAHDLRTPLTSVRARLERLVAMAGPETACCCGPDLRIRSTANLTSRGQRFRRHHAAAYADRGENHDPTRATHRQHEISTEDLTDEPAIREQHLLDLHLVSV